jgi:hypothetical protein
MLSILVTLKKNRPMCVLLLEACSWGLPLIVKQRLAFFFGDFYLKKNHTFYMFFSI